MKVPSSPVATDLIGRSGTSVRYTSIVAPAMPSLEDRATTVPVIWLGRKPALGSALPKACSRTLSSVVVASTTFFRFLEKTMPKIDAATSRPMNENIKRLIRGV